MTQMRMELQPQVELVVQGVVAVGVPSASLKEIYRKVLELNEAQECGYATDTLRNSVRRAIYEHLGDDEEGVFVRDGRGCYRLSISVVVSAIVLADSREFIRLLPDESLDCVVTDPPWSYMNQHRAWGTTTRLTHMGWFETYDLDAAFLKELSRVMKESAHAYLFFPPLTRDTIALLRDVSDWIEEAGLVFQKQLVWDKESFGMGWRYRNQYEAIMLFSKGKMKPLNSNSIGDVISVPRVKKPVHPTEKPVELLKTLVMQSTLEGELVADFFAGSGATGAACVEMGRAFLMVDIDVKWTAHMSERLSSARKVEVIELCPLAVADAARNGSETPP